MVKKIVSVEVNTCDFCGEEDCYHTCMGCGKDICYECRKTQATELPHSVYCTGTGDGEYCSKCAADPKIQNTPLFRSYHAVRSLWDELQGFQQSFEIRRKAAEEECKKQYEAWSRTVKEAR